MPHIDIAEVRKKLGEPGKEISQAELGRRLGGVDQATVSRWENGVSNPPKSAVILMQQWIGEPDSSGVPDSPPPSQEAVA